MQSLTCVTIDYTVIFHSICSVQPLVLDVNIEIRHKGLGDKKKGGYTAADNVLIFNITKHIF